MQNIRGWIGVGMFLIGIVMTIFEQTRGASWFVLGAGLGLICSGFG